MGVQDIMLQNENAWASLAEEGNADDDAKEGGDGGDNAEDDNEDNLWAEFQEREQQQQSRVQFLPLRPALDFTTNVKQKAHLCSSLKLLLV